MFSLNFWLVVRISLLFVRQADLGHPFHAVVVFFFSLDVSVLVETWEHFFPALVEWFQTT